MLLKHSKKAFILGLKFSLILGVLVSVVIQLPSFQKLITITVDGQQQDVNVDGVYATDLMQTLDQIYGPNNYMLDTTIDTQQFLKDLNELGIKTRKEITFIKDGTPIQQSTFLTSMKEFVKELDTTFDISVDEVLTSGTVLEQKTVEQPLIVEVRENNTVDAGTETVLQEGVSTTIRELFLHTDVPKLLVTTVLTEGQPRIVEKGTKEKQPEKTPAASAPAPAVPSDSVWDQLAMCESGGRWNVNTGNGYHGGLQFSPTTWNTASGAVGLDIDYAYEATREQQILAATWLQEKAGWGQWPSCTSKLGLR